MKKTLLIFTLTLLIGISAYVAYKKFYPKIVAQAVVDKKYLNLLPKKYSEKLTTISDTVNSKLDKVITSTATEGIELKQLENAVLEIKKEDVELIYQKLRKTNIKSVEQVFDTITNNIKIKSFNLESLREPFLHHVEKKHIKKGMKYIEMHDLFNTIDEESARQIALQILKQKESKIKKKLEETN
ncbi:hypothetical protein ABWH96_20420 [Marivirga tractuosa]|uniref:hypothetical protein n=1 Tax=Marivirga tractuosa TaxID=1006 RepID=UPI0035CFCBBF